MSSIKGARLDLGGDWKAKDRARPLLNGGIFDPALDLLSKSFD
jgi:hypothetical protein